ncbi:rhoptry protein ROP14 [Besnoitia besnoiti]|uniref:Rhoptry protein ROP14 n=1 Tax=Besnoitia besnoiti TaxID=94643 RepID=A0A2A9MD93_BESBE|nr:rhoptry protein ROP14 [Besnoitia besnoiti]PFH33653.1 rhoptry protein ROP14 [Besnoitia besnoiti]
MARLGLPSFAFGLQGTYSRNPSLAPSSRDWKTYEFFCKPGGINRRPCIVTPYYYRLDWLMWFAAFRPDLQPPLWLLRMVKKLLANDAKTTALLLRNPFQGKSPPRFIRILRYDYHFAYKGKVRPASASLLHSQPLAQRFLCVAPNLFCVPLQDGHPRCASGVPRNGEFDVVVSRQTPPHPAVYIRVHEFLLQERKQYEQGAWWERKYMSQFLPPVEARMFRGD